MTKLLKLKLDDTRHKDRALWIDPTDGTLYYGVDSHNLIFPDGLELASNLPPLSLLDLKRAYLLGKTHGESEQA